MGVSKAFVGGNAAIKWKHYQGPQASLTQAVSLRAMLGTEQVGAQEWVWDGS